MAFRLRVFYFCMCLPQDLTSLRKLFDIQIYSLPFLNLLGRTKHDYILFGTVWNLSSIVIRIKFPQASVSPSFNPICLRGTIPCILGSIFKRYVCFQGHSTGLDGHLVWHSTVVLTFLSNLLPVPSHRPLQINVNFFFSEGMAHLIARIAQITKTTKESAKILSAMPEVMVSVSVWLPYNILWLLIHCHFLPNGLPGSLWNC